MTNSQSTTKRNPLRVMFLLTSMPIGGAETLLVNLVRRMDPGRCIPFIGCLKERGELGDVLADEVPVFEKLINFKFDVAVTLRLKKLFVENQIDAVITVGAGDKMFWGRLAARQARIPVILSALHSTGWPDGVGRLNRMLTGITDGFIAVAKQHADYQVEQEGFPSSKVFLIPNGIDTDRFVYDETSRHEWRSRIGIAPDAPVVGIVAALRPEKNHDLFLETARRVWGAVPNANFVIAGDGPERERLETVASEMGIQRQVKFIGSTRDIPGVLSMCDLFSLTSHNEASPVSIMEALSCGRPVVATDVGSIDECVLEGRTGYLVEPGNAEQMSDRWSKLLNDKHLRDKLGQQGRSHVIDSCSLDTMTQGYMSLIENVYAKKKGLPTSSIQGYVSWESNLITGEHVTN